MAVTVSGGTFTTTVVAVGSNEATSGTALAGQISSALNSGALVGTDGTNPPTGRGAQSITTTGVFALEPAVTTAVIAPSTNQTTGASSVAGGVTVYGSGASNQFFLVDNTPVALATGGGSGTIVTGDGDNLIGSPTAGGSAFHVYAGAGNDTISMPTGSNSINAGGGNNLIASGFEGTLSSNFISITGNDTVSAGGSGTDTVTLTTGTAYVAMRTKSLLFVGNDTVGGAATIMGGSGSDSVALGYGGGYVEGGTAGHNELASGLGPNLSVLTGGGDGDTLIARGAGTSILIAGVGNETLTGAGSTGANSYYTASGGTTLVFGGAGAELFSIGRSTDTGAFSGLFNITTGAGEDTVSFYSHPTSSAYVALTDVSNVDRLAGLAGQQTAVMNAAASASSVTLNDGTTLKFTTAVTLTNSNFV